MSNSNSRKGKFLKDLGLYSIGSIGSKLITFLLVPLYTYAINPDDFGYYDICLTVIFFFGPIISFQLGDGGFRFLLETKNDDIKKEIVSFVVKSIFRNAVVTTALVVMASCFVEIKFGEIKYVYLVILYGLLQTVFDVSLQLTRGLGNTKIYMLAGIINSISIASFTILFIVILKWELMGLFLANIVARFISFSFVVVRSHLLSKYFSFQNVNKVLAHQMLKYSLPMMPAVLIWMILNGSHVFFIKHFLGLSENGIYAVLAKFSSILYVLSSIFYQTWQQNAIEQYESPDRDCFFSKVFNNYLYLLGGLLITFPLLLKINYGWMVGPEYQASKQYLFFNSLYMVIYALAAFFEIGYQCAKKTARILPSFILITIVGLTLYYYLIPLLGLNGVILASLLTYAVLLIYRVFDTRRYMKIHFDNANYFLLVLVGAAGCIFHLNLCNGYSILALVVLTGMYLMVIPRHILQMIKFRFGKRYQNNAGD